MRPRPGRKDASPRSAPRRAAALAAALVAALALAWFALRGDLADAPAGGAPAFAPATADSAARPDPAAARVDGAAAPVLAPGATRRVDAAQLARSGTLRLRLDLEHVPSDLGAIPGRLLRLDGSLGPRALEAVVAASGEQHASVELPADWLPPGRYLVELRTRERTHLPLRRYLVEVRAAGAEP